MVLLLLLCSLIALGREMFSCYESLCPDSWLGDGYCDSVCMIPGCDYDSAFVGSSAYETFINSDCSDDCACDEAMLTNGVCDSDCNNYECGWDLGECGYCASGCFESNLTGSDSDPSCKSVECLYGNNYYGWCYENCFYDDIFYQDTCKSECNTNDCLRYYANPCLSNLCAPGCTDDLKENESCDSECNNAECDYDNGECYCSKDCPSTEGDCTTSGDTTDGCDNEDCGFKDGKCGYCASGCYLDELGDGTCQTECNNENCYFDFGDCGCSYNCSYIYDSDISDYKQLGSSDACSTYCLVPDCNFASNFCDTNEIIQKGVMNQIVYQNSSHYLDLGDCECTSDNITSYLSDTLTCKEEYGCYSKECFYCMGKAEDSMDNCVRQSFEDCLVCSTTMVGATCNKDLTSCPYGYVENSKLSELFGIDLWCLREPVRYTKSNYQKIYVDTSSAENGEYGDITNPYYSLYYAFIRVYATYTKIFLLNQEIDFYYDKSTSPFINDKYDPLNSNSIYETKELWIIGSYSDTVKTKIYFLDNLKITPLAKQVYIQNIEFIGSKVLKNSCATETCYYCPYLTFQKNTYFNDRNEIIDSDTVKSDYSTTCSSYSAVNVFKFSTKVYIENVEFVGFRYQFNSFISSSSVLSLINVNFTKMQAKSTGSIIMLACTTDCIDSWLTYESGEVADIGYGYDDSEYVSTGSFIMSSGIGYITITNVKFTYNFLLINKQSSNFGYLLYSTNHLGTIIISDCEFSSNYVNYLIYIDVNTLVYTDYRYSEGLSLSYYQQHFQMNNVVISNTYCSEGLVYYSMKKVVHNINIKDLTITNSVMGNSGILQFVNQGTLTDSDVNGTTIKKPINGEQTKIYISPRYLTLENIDIKNSYIGYCAIYISKYANANLLNVSIIDISDGAAENIQDIIDTFSQSGRYLSKIDEETELPELNCNEMILISSTSNLNVDVLTISSINCLVEVVPSGISLQKITVNANLRELTLSNMESSVSSGLVFTAINSLNINITGLYIENVLNDDESIIYFESCQTLTMDSVTINQVYSKYSGSFTVLKSKLFNLSNFKFNNSTSEFGNGGCLYLQTGIYGSKYSIKSGVFTSCIANSGNGGALYIDGISTASNTSIETDDIEILNCESSEGSAIYISSIISLSEETENKIAGTVIENNSCYEGGVITDYHKKGVLIFDGLEMNSNSGIYGGIYCFYSSDLSELQIQNSNFYNIENQDSLFYFRSLTNRALIVFESVNVINSTKGVTIDMYLVNVQAKNLNITTVHQGIQINSKSLFEATDFIFSDCYWETIILSSVSGFTCINCVFKNNEDGIIISKTTSSFYLENTEIVSNDVDSTYLISVIDSDSDDTSNTESGLSILVNCKIYSNVLDSGNFIYVSSSKMIINGTLFTDNAANSRNVFGIYLSKSNIDIYNSTFQPGSQSESGAFIYAVSQSVVIADGSIFRNSFSDLGNIYGIAVTLNINNCEFLSNTGVDIYVLTSKLYLTDTVFKDSVITQSNLGAVSMISSNTTSISGCSFTGVSSNDGLTGTSNIYDSSSKKLSVTNTDLTGLNNNVIGLYVYKCTSIILEKLTVDQFYSDEYSAVTIRADSKSYSLSIKDSKITENYSKKNGGGLYVENYNTTIEDTEISFNTAEGSGGGIYYTSASCNNCGIYIEGNTEIFNNTCLSDGGGIKWEDFKPLIEKSELIYNNSAAYGSELATVPAKFGLGERRRLSELILGTILDFGPGKLFEEYIPLYIYDTYGEVVKTENSLIAILTVNESSSKTSSVSGTTKFTAQEGVLYLTNFILTGQPGSSMYLKISSESIRSTGARNDDTEYLNEAFINIEFRQCTNGEQIQQTGCVNCEKNKYTIKPSSNCKSCPTGATCPGADIIIVDNGYWRSSIESDVVYECEIFGACLKGNTTDELGSCTSGYSGVLCQSCEIGYSKTGDGKCAKCPSQAANIAILIILCFCIIFVSVVLVKTTLKSAFSPKALHSIYIKIFTNYLQLVFIVTQFKLEWPTYVVQLFNIQKSAATVSDQIFSIDCYLAQKNSDDSSEGYYVKLCMVAAMPLFIFLIAYVYWICHGSVYQTYKPLKREVYTTIIVLFFLVYPNIVKLLFSNFSCVSIDQMDSYLKDNTAIQCWDSRHKRYSFIVAIPGIILWAIGFPTLLLLLMGKNKRRLHLDHYRVIFGFLYNGFRHSRFFWEFVIMYRKILLISIAVFMASEALILQALNVVIVLFISVYLQYGFKPYNNLELNHMEMQALAVASITIYCGLYYLSKSIGDGIKMVLFIAIVLGNSYFILYWIYYMLQALVDMFIKIFPQFKLLCKRGDAFEEEFNTEKIVQEGVFYNPLEGAKAYTFFEMETQVKPKKMKYRNMNDAYRDVIRNDIEKMGNEE